MKDRKKADFFTRQPVKFTPYFDRERVKEVLQKHKVDLKKKIPSILSNDIVIHKEDIDEILADLCEPEEQPTLTDEEIDKQAQNYCVFQGQDGEPEFDQKAYMDYTEGVKFARQFYEGKIIKSDKK